jgi:hypothetical protein
MQDYIGSLEFTCPRCKRENHRKRFITSTNSTDARHELSDGAKCHFCLFRLGTEAKVKVELSATEYATAA